jgi:hypothetical protein
MNKIVSLHPIQSEDQDWNGSFLALHEDGALSRVQIGNDADGPCAKLTPVPYLAG